MKQVLILIDHEEWAIRPQSLELAAAASSLSPEGLKGVLGIMLGHDIVPLAEKFASSTGIDVVAAECAELEHYSAEGYLTALGDIIPPLLPALILAAHSSVGCDFAPALAAKLGLPLVTAVEEMHPDGEGRRFLRAAWHGKAREEICLSGGAAVITVMPGAYRAADEAAGSPGKITLREISLALRATSNAKSVPAAAGNAALAGAEVVVSAGRGVRKEEHMALLAELASLFPRSAIGGSRLACDMGLVDYGSQIGMTGRTVAPKLYIACGISGAAQHLAGMKGSRHIVAINSDAHAPIFRIADFGIVDELEQFIPAFIGAAERHRVKS